MRKPNLRLIEQTGCGLPVIHFISERKRNFFRYISAVSNRESQIYLRVHRRKGKPVCEIIK